MKPKLTRTPIMEDDSDDEYKFAKCNVALLKETIRDLRESAGSAARSEWPMLACSEDGWDERDETEAVLEVTQSPTVSARKRSISASSSSNVKRARRLSAPLSDPEESPGGPTSSPPPPPDRVLTPAPTSPAARPASPASPAAVRSISDLPPPPSSSELTMTVHPAAAAAAAADVPQDGLLTAADVARLAALPTELLAERLRQAGHLRLEPNLVRVAAAEALDTQTAALWLEHALTPKLLSGEMPSAELVSALVGLAGRHPDAVIEHCLLPLSAGDRMACDDLVLRLVTDGLQGPSRTQLVRRLCGRPLSAAAVSLLLSLLPVCPLSADLASTLTDSLASAAGEVQHRSSAAFARLLLVTVQKAGKQLDAEDRGRLATAAEQGQTALRRAVQAALRRLQ